MLFYIYSDSPSSTIDITSRCRVGRLSVKDNAEEGSVAISSLIIDDPDGDLEITGHRRMYIYESDAPIHDQVIFNGFVVNERTERGPYRTGAGRQWVVDLADPNVLINRRIMNGADANRPAETDLARIQALLTMTELNTVDDDTYVNTGAATVLMDAVDYRGQNVGAYIDDCRQASGKNGYILYNETVGQYGLWYDFPQSTVYDSNCFLTNGIGENNDSTIFLYSEDRTYLNADPSRVASGIYLEYDGGTVYVQDPATTAAFAAIDWAAPSINVKSLTKATARANRYLADASTEHYIIHTVMTKVPRANVNKIKKGELAWFRSSYMTGFTVYVQCRVLYRTLTEISEDPQASYEIEMDLDPLSPQPECTFVPYSGLTGSSEDIFGAFLGTTGNFNPGAPYAYTYQQPSSPAPGLYGVPNNGSNWGELSGVFAPMVISAWFQWDLDDLGTPAICTVMMRSSEHGEAFQTLEASNDLMDWDTIVDFGWTSTVPYSSVSPFWTYRYWRLRIDDNHPGGYNVGVDNEFLMLFAAE